jgi:hypothetical protein
MLLNSAQTSGVGLSGVMFGPSFWGWRCSFDRVLHSSSYNSAKKTGSDPYFRSSSQFKFCPDAIRLPAIGAGAWVAASAGEFAIFRSILK